MRIEQLSFPMIRAIVNRPRVSEALFRFDSWGNALGPDRYSYPYPIYDRMRADGPVTFRRLYNQWFVTGHDEAKEILASPDVIVSPQRELMLSISPYTKLNAHGRSFIDHILLLIDPPDHTRLRRLVSRAFSPRQIARVEDDVEVLANRLIDEMLSASGPEGRPIEVVEAFTGPLPINVICQLLGVPEERWGWAKEVSEQISAVGNLFAGFDPDECGEAFTAMWHYFLGLAEERRKDPRDDLITALAATGEDGDRLNDDELVGMIGLLMFAGHETTSGLLGNSIIALANNPEQRRLIRKKPELWENAVEELLRWDTPLQSDVRAAARDLTLGEQRIKKGQAILIMPGAANRDPNFYDDPNVLRLDRDDPQPVSFGHGMHHCLGHALARMETKVAMHAFIDRLGDYTVDDSQTVWKQSIITRGPNRLVVRPGERHDTEA